MATIEASFERIDNGEVRLTGAWTLLLDPALRRRLARELATLDAPHHYRWDLTQVEALDSAGARVLWDAWSRRLPAQFACHADHRHWFEWLAGTRVPVPRVHNRVGIAIDRVGSRAIGFARTLAGVLVLVGQLMLDLAYCVRHPRVTPWKEMAATVYHVGATSMLLLGCVGFLIGVVMTIQLGMALRQFGAALLVVGTMGLAVLRELGPVICGLILAGRSGSAMTSGIGAMHLTGEYDALRAFGSAPSLRLALPRVVGATISLPLLVVWTDFAALIGGAVTAQADLGVGWRLFLTQLPEKVAIVNLWIGLAKGALFGLTLAVVGCYFGMTAPANTAGLSRNTTLSVVSSLTLILVFDASSGALLTHVGLL